ncbi:hypothetical protein GN958_ATG02505 [Phytophthora infestans]|uniref:Uncharacterized protein n=1 Tax=Phytophthora infestans TaxID=4787 RepID=A0A8S9V838_PHYIN|nr:hypothetical protein GN958_ATG02505 [Phytophthora infestans]
MQSSGTVCAVQSEDVINRAEIINAVGSRLVDMDMYSSTQPGWETMTNAMVEKVFGKFAVDAITADRRKQIDGPWSPTSPPSSPVLRQGQRQVGYLSSYHVSQQTQR